MIGVEHILLMNTGVSSIALLVLLFLSTRKNHKSENKNEHLTADMRKIKEQVSSDE